MSNPFLDRDVVKRKQPKSYWRSKKQEKQVAKEMGGRCTPKSGSGRIKGDVRCTGIARVECKTTSAKSFSVTKEMLDKIQLAGIGSDEIPIMVVEFNTNGKAGDMFAVLSYNDLLGLLDCAKQLTEKIDTRKTD